MLAGHSPGFDAPCPFSEELISTHRNADAPDPWSRDQFRSFAFGEGGDAAATERTVLSMFSVTVAVARFPARSTASPVITCLTLSRSTRTGERSSPRRTSCRCTQNVTVTSELFHPVVFAAGVEFR